jgi:hypothetical protein
MKDDKLHLLLAHDDDGTPVLKDGLPDAAASEQEPEKKKDKGAQDFWEEGGDPNDLDEQRWGVIAPEGPQGDRLLSLIRPLIEARREQQGGHDVQIYRVPSRLSPAEAVRWRKAHFDTGADVSTDLPRYQVLLGDLHELSLAVQQSQGSDGFVGRLCFQAERDYEAYVDKVLRWEKAAVEAEARAKFFTVHDGTAATMIGYQSLIQPGLELLRKRQIDAEELGDREVPSPSEFLETVRRPDPTVLFSVSHGAGAPRAGWSSYDEQRERQGSMSFGREGKLAGADVGDAPFLPGGVWFMLACYGAGTPDVSAYRHWLERLKQVGQFGGQAQAVLKGLPAENQAPFIARLPQTVLANSSGPLAVMGHIDLAWTYSFEERDTGKATSRPAKFIEVVRSSLRGDRAGIAFRQLIRFMSQANHELAELYDVAEREAEAHVADGARRGHLWMLRQDLAGYILLGDPAVRLPGTGKRKGQGAGAPAKASPSMQAARPVEVREQPKAEAPAQAPAAVQPAAKLPADIDTLEEAIGHLLVGRGLNDVAKEYGIDRAELRRLADTYKKAGRGALGAP